MAIAAAASDHPETAPERPLEDASRIRYDGAALVRILEHPPDAELARLGIEPWADHPGPRQWLALVPAPSRPALDASGIAYAVVVPDLGPRLEREHLRLTARGSIEGGSLDPSFFDDFRELGEVLDRLDALADAAPQLVTLVEIGTSLEGRPIRGLRIARPIDGGEATGTTSSPTSGGSTAGNASANTSANTSGDTTAGRDSAGETNSGTSRGLGSTTTGADPSDERPVVLVNGCQHAREWITVSSTMAIADALVAGSGFPTDLDVHDLDPAMAAAVDALLDEVVFVVIPVVNPDGYAFSFDRDRLWRKNRRDDHGVDLNRNWGVGFGGRGSSGNPEKNNYRGTEAFSEPESDAMRAFMEAEPNLRAHIDFHSFGQLVLYPWAFDFTVPPDAKALGALADEVAVAMAGPHGSEYDPRQGVDFYPAAGIFPDWSYGTLGARSFTIELRPSMSMEFPDGFIIEPEQIRPVADEALVATLTLAQWAAAARPGAPGDDGDAPYPPEDTGGSGDGTAGTTGAADGPAPAGTSTGSGVDVEIPGGTGGAGLRVDEVDSGCACSSRPWRHDDAAAWTVLLLGLLPVARRRR